jgi:hypothetical protein
MHACEWFDHHVHLWRTALAIAAAVGVCICVLLLLLLLLLAIRWPACVYVILLMSLGTFSPTYRMLHALLGPSVSFALCVLALCAQMLVLPIRLSACARVLQVALLSCVGQEQAVCGVGMITTEGLRHFMPCSRQVLCAGQWLLGPCCWSLCSSCRAERVMAEQQQERQLLPLPVCSRQPLLISAAAAQC